MKIKRISCEQFAGLVDQDIQFDDGLNLVVGANESGKSTLIDLIYHMFFQDCVIDNRTKNKTFKERYFPRSNDAFQGDSIDGTILFETEDGRLKLSKEWAAKGGQARLVLPDKTRVSDEQIINKALSDALVYGKGIYDELLFASQRREQSILSSLLGDSGPSENVKDLSSAITRAVMETGGVDIEKMEADLAEKVRQYEGHWDFDMDLPEGGKRRGINNKWKKEVGRILAAYYDKEDVAQKQADAIAAEKAVEEANATVVECKAELEALKVKQEEFYKVRNIIAEYSSNNSLYEVTRQTAVEQKEALANWPVKVAALEQAHALKEELQDALDKELYRSVKVLMDVFEEQHDALRGIGTVGEQDVAEAEKCESKIFDLENRLKGMNLVAKIHRFGDAEISINSAISGEPLSSGDGTVEISEAVDIMIPGIAEIQLSPKGTDLAQVRQEIEAVKAKQAAIFAKFKVHSTSDLQKKHRDSIRLSNDLNLSKAKIEAQLNGVSWDTLCERTKALPEIVRSSTAISIDLKALCGTSAESFIGKLSGEIEQYENKYGSQGELIDAKARTAAELQKLEAKLKAGAAIPEDFAGIQDADAYDAELKEQIKVIEGDLSWYRTKLSSEERKLSEVSAEALSEEYQRVSEKYERTKTEYAHWKHILDTFRNVKNTAKGNPLSDIEATFASYLQLMTDGRLSRDGIEDDMKSSITSGKFHLSEDILSDGTKDTISLAFRLAVLNHLYPNGGCVAIFDDPFTDMDPERTMQACRLIQEFAKSNQVIFVTCDEKYKGLMNGNCIEMAG